MNRINLPLLLLIIIAFLSCKKRKTESAFVYSEYANADSVEIHKPNADSISFIQGYGVKLFYDENHNLQRLGGKVFGKYYGHFFKMNVGKNFNTALDFGKVTSYIYQNYNWQSYFMKYDSKTNSYLENGSPCVDYFVFYNEGDTTIRYTFHFSTFPRRDIESQYSLDGKTYSKFNLRKSYLMPFLQEAQIFLRRAQQKIFIKSETSNLRFAYPKLQDRKTFIDTMSLIP